MDGRNLQFPLTFGQNYSCFEHFGKFYRCEKWQEDARASGGSVFFRECPTFDTKVLPIMSTIGSDVAFSTIFESDLTGSFLH